LKQFGKYLKNWRWVLLLTTGLLVLLPWDFFNPQNATQQADRAAIILLAKAIALLGLVVFTFRMPIHFTQKLGVLGAAFANLAMLAGLAGIAVQMRQAVLKRHIPLDFDHFFQLERTGGLALIATLVLAIALFFFFFCELWSVIQSGILRRQRSRGMLIALGIFGFGVLFLPDPLTPVQLLLSGIAYVALFDFYIERRVSNLTGLLFWAVMISGWLGLLLFQFNLKEDRETRLDLARELTVPGPINPERLAKYDYAVFLPDGQVRESGGKPSDDLPDEARLFKEGQWKEYFSAVRADLV